MEPEKGPACGARVIELLDGIFLTASDAGIDEIAAVDGKRNFSRRFVLSQRHIVPFPDSKKWPDWKRILTGKKNAVNSES
jgi:hypothetical protein